MRGRNNKNIALCSNCGGTLGEPLHSIDVSQDQFSIYLGGGSSTTWSYYFSFKYDTQYKEWYLAEISEGYAERFSRDGDTGNYTKSESYTYPKNLKYTNLENFDFLDMEIKKFIKKIQ